MQAAIYARVSTTDQTAGNQLLELRRYCEARGWTAVEYVDTGISGSKDRRPALDKLMADAHRRKIDVVIVWRLDRFGRNMRHLVTAIEDLHSTGVAFLSLGESIDTTTPTGRLMLGIMASFAEFEKARIVERVHAGLARAKRQGKRLGRPRVALVAEAASGLTVRQAAALWGCSKSTAARRLAAGEAPASVAVA